MNFDMINEAPMPLSLKRNGQGSEVRDVIADQDACGNYFGASLRRGPFMSV